MDLAWRSMILIRTPGEEIKPQRTQRIIREEKKEKRKRHFLCFFLVIFLRNYMGKGNQVEIPKLTDIMQTVFRSQQKRPNIMKETVPAQAMGVSP